MTIVNNVALVKKKFKKSEGSTIYSILNTTFHLSAIRGNQSRVMYLPTERKLVTTLQEEHVACTSSTFVDMIFLLQILADEINYLKDSYFRNVRYTYNFADFVLDLQKDSHCNGVISVTPVEIGDDLQTFHFLIVVNQPSTWGESRLSSKYKIGLTEDFRE